MPQKLRTTYFEYWDEAPHDWPRIIEERLLLGASEITIPILWGVHESSPGIKDFSKQSKLRIEKLFTIIQSLGASIRVVVGFPLHKLAFPAWANDLSDCELVPGSLWYGKPPYFSLVRVPSPRSPKLLEGFRSFFEEVSSILSLYLSPEGPIKKVEIALSPLQFSQSYLRETEYVKNLEDRYCDISIFNKRFQTNYKNFAAVTTSMGTKLVESKRPWLYAYDYHWARSRFVEDYLKLVLKTEMPESLRNIIKPEGSDQAVNSNVENRGIIFFESTLVEFENPHQISPLMINGQLSSSSVHMFQWAKMLSECAGSAELDLIPLCPVGTHFDSNSKVASVFCGKYLSSSAARVIQQKLDAGGFLFFPAGLPQFDENLDSHNWATIGLRKTTKLGDLDWCVVQKNRGYIFFPAQTTEGSSLRTIRSWLKRFSSVSEDLIGG